jgi:predicted metal-binding protein
MDKRALAARAADETGFFQYGFVPVSELKTSEEVRKMCESNVCRRYGATWACPPAFGTVSECAERLKKYGEAMIFSRKYDLDDSFDFEGMTAGAKDFHAAAERLWQRVKTDLPEGLLMANEGCVKCEKCTYPDAPCRFPDSLHPSLEGYGFMVSEVAAQAGINYINGANTVTYFGALFF